MGSWGWAASGFLWAGVGATAVPLILHWLRRRRRRVVRWGPMHLLRQVTVRRQRRWQLRDVGLLALRMLALILFGLALARPQLLGIAVHSSATSAPAVMVLVDNSFSMHAERLGKSNWERVPEKFDELVDALPVGSQVCVLPTCRQLDDGIVPAYDSAARARELLRDWQPVDQALSLQALLVEVQTTLTGLPQPPEMIYLITDHQRRNGLISAPTNPGQEAPPLNIVPLESVPQSNLWIEDLEVSPQLLVAGDSISIRVTLGIVGTDVPPQVPITLWIDEREIATQLVDTADKTGLVVCNFQYAVPRQAATVAAEESRAPQFLVVRATIPSDNLPLDDQRAVVSPVVARVPLICLEADGDVSLASDTAVDDPESSTYFLRHFWTAVYGDDDAQPIPWVRLDGVDREQLRQHQVAVLASERVPSESELATLRDFVQEGGQLWIAPHGQFDPSAWNQAAWRNGRGILPAPLLPETLGAKTWDELSANSLLRIDPASLDLDQLGGLSEVSREGLRELYADLVLFRAVGVDVSTRELEPSPPVAPTPDANPPADVWGPTLVLARTGTGVPMALYRRLGAGGVLFWGTGLTPQWNNMPGSHGVVCWEHLGRFLLTHEVTRPVFQPADIPRLRLRHVDGTWDWRLLEATRGTALEMIVRQHRDAQGRYVALEEPLPRGSYLLEGQNRANDRQLRLPLVVAPAAESWEASESNLALMDDGTWTKFSQASPAGEGGERESVLVGAPQRDSLWQILLAAVLLCLGVESLICWFRPQDAAAAAAG